ncbi:MAG: helix-turn-helix domain-containing protein [Firmicutes bacterium]|nr:helix-turn-helix domain-containing protein [Bacillota bacterium]
MDLIKIGEFIATKRKENGLTQMAVAEKLHITDRAVSKWECGKGLPDISIVQPLCNVLGITINELLSGEEIPKEEQAVRAEKQIMDLLYSGKGMGINRTVILGISMIFVATLLFVTLYLFSLSYKIYVPLFLVFVALGSITLSYADMTHKHTEAKKFMPIIFLGMALVILSPIPFVTLYGVINIGIVIGIFFAVLAIAFPILIYGGVKWDKALMLRAGK